MSDAAASSRHDTPDVNLSKGQSWPSWEEYFICSLYFALSGSLLLLMLFRTLPSFMFLLNMVLGQLTLIPFCIIHEGGHAAAALAARLIVLRVELPLPERLYRIRRSEVHFSREFSARVRLTLSDTAICPRLRLAIAVLGGAAGAITTALLIASWRSHGHPVEYLFSPSLIDGFSPLQAGLLLVLCSSAFDLMPLPTSWLDLENDGIMLIHIIRSSPEEIRRRSATSIIDELDQRMKRDGHPGKGAQAAQSLYETAFQLFPDAAFWFGSERPNWVFGFWASFSSRNYQSCRNWLDRARAAGNDNSRTLMMDTFFVPGAARLAYAAFSGDLDYEKGLIQIYRENGLLPALGKAALEIFKRRDPCGQLEALVNPKAREEPESCPYPSELQAA